MNDLILPFLSALAGETIVWEDNACRKGRLRKYLFYEMIVTPSLVRLVREDPDLRSDLNTAILWYGNYRSMFRLEGKTNEELESLYEERGRPLLVWKEWFANKSIFTKGLSWQRIYIEVQSPEAEPPRPRT